MASSNPKDWPKFVRIRGDTMRLRFFLKDDLGNILDPDDHTLFFSVHDPESGEPLVQHQSTIGQFTTIDSATGEFEVKLVPANSDDLEDDGVAYPCVVVAQNDDNEEVARCRATLTLIDGILDEPAISLPVTTTNPEAGFNWDNIAFRPAAITAIEDLVPAADRFMYFDGEDSAQLATLTAAARGLLDDATVADMRTTLEVYSSAQTDTAIANAIAALVGTAGAALDTLGELSDALADDANFAATVTTSLAGKQPLDADLTAIAALTTLAYGRSLLELADAAALRATASVYSIAQVDAALATKQPLDATLTALAAFNSNGILTQTAADTFVARTLTAGHANVAITDGNGVAGNPTFALAAALTDINSIQSATGQNLVLTGNGGASLTLAQGSSGNAIFGFTGNGRMGVGKTPSATAGFDQRVQVKQLGTTYAGFGVEKADDDSTLAFGYYGTASAWALVSTYSTSGSYLPIAVWVAAGEVMRLTTTRNLLIGGTTDITGSGGAKIFGTTAATSTTSGAFQMPGIGMGNGAIYAGTANFSGTGTFGNSVTSSNNGASPFIANITAAPGGVFGGYQLQRSGAAKGYLGLDASDNPVILTTSGATLAATFSGANTTLAGNLTVSGTGTDTHAGTVRVATTDATKSFSVGSLTPPTTNTVYQAFIGAGVQTGQTAGGGEYDVGWNFYYNSGWKARLTDVASRLSFNATSGETAFWGAASTSADAAISWTKQAVFTNTAVGILPTTASTSTTTGALTVAGGVGVQGDQWTAGTGRFLRLGVGRDPSASIAIQLGNDSLTGTGQVGLNSVSVFTSAATAFGKGINTFLRTAAMAFTMTAGYGIYIQEPEIGAGSEVAIARGIYVTNQGAAGITHAYGIDIAAQSGAATTNIGLRNAGTTLLTNRATIGAGTAATTSEQLRISNSIGSDTQTRIRLDNNAAAGYSTFDAYNDQSDYIAMSMLGSTYSGMGGSAARKGSIQSSRDITLSPNGASALTYTFTTTGLSVTPTTASTSTTTGALTVAGGVGIAGATFVGGRLEVGPLSVSGANAAQISVTSTDTSNVPNAFPSLALGNTSNTANNYSYLSFYGSAGAATSTGMILGRTTNQSLSYGQIEIQVRGASGFAREVIVAPGLTTLAGNLTVSGTGTNNLVGNIHLNGTGAGTGAFFARNGTTDAATKSGFYVGGHYTNAEEPVLGVSVSSLVATNVVTIGGGSNLYNAATAIDFYTAANNTTVTGTRRGGFSSTGVFDVATSITGTSTTAAALLASSLGITGKAFLGDTLTLSGVNALYLGGATNTIRPDGSGFVQIGNTAGATGAGVKLVDNNAVVGMWQFTSGATYLDTTSGVLNVRPAGTTALTLSATEVTVASGIALKLGNAAVAETPSATHTVTVKDNTGTSYKLLALAA